jgi:outer membrane receptor protein involved in Fe transport
MKTPIAMLAAALGLVAPAPLLAQAQTSPSSPTPSSTTAPAAPPSSTPAPAAPVPTPAQVAGPAANAPSEENAVVQLSPFDVSAREDQGYEATQTLAGTRINTNLGDVAAAISVYNQDFLNDIGALDAGTFLQYTTNAEVAGTEGTYSGIANSSGQSLSEVNNLIDPEQSQRIRGLAAADNTRGYFVTDIPWDSFDVDRIDILRGPNSFLYGLGSPAGIVNASLKEAAYRDFGSVSTREGSYGSTRGTLDINRVLIPGVLAIRVDTMYDDRKYEQDPAFQNQSRVYAALRFDPNFFKNSSFHTTIKMNVETGDISADRPRILPPYDDITAWWRPNSVSASNPYGGMGRAVANNPYDPWMTTGNGITAGTDQGMLTAGTVNYSPYLQDAANQQQPIWALNGSNGQLYSVYGGYINNGWVSSTGSALGISSAAPGKISNMQLAMVGGIPNVAQGYALPGYQYGQYRSQSITDPGLFDFYNKLIDGPTASEYERWTAYNVDLQETGFNDRVGLDVTYNRQNYGNGGESLLGWGPAITMDIMQNEPDYYLSGANGETSQTNPNFGRPMVLGAGNNGGQSYRSTRQTWRASLYAELKASDFLHNDFLVKLLGTHRFNFVASNDQYYDENKDWQMYANSQAWDGYWNGNSGASNAFNNRPPVAAIYLGSSVMGASSPGNLNIPNIGSQINLPSHGVYVFDSTYNSTVSPGAIWNVPSSLSQIYYGAPNTPATQLYQDSNPSNYVGWNSNFVDNLITDNGTSNTLLTTAEQAFRENISYAASYQAYLWQHAVVGTLGWRYDEVETKDATAPYVTLDRNEVNLSNATYALPNSFPLDQIFKQHSTAAGIVLHLNDLLPANLQYLLPIDISGSFNDSKNFEITNVRVDVYGNPIPNPTGKTKEYGLTLATKDHRFSVRVTKYDTLEANDTSTLGNPGGIGTTIAQGLRWRNVWLYQLGGYTIDTENESSYRNTWTGAYPTETAAQAQAQEDAAITGWNNIQEHLEGTNFFKAWGIVPTGPDSVLVNRTTYLTNPSAYQPIASTVSAYSVPAGGPQGFAVTADTESKGYEFDATANPLPNWRISFNAAETTATENNVGGAALTQLVSYMQSQLYNPDGTPTPAGLMPQYGNASLTIDLNNFGPWLQNYQLLKLQEGSDVSELRKWRYNLITDYQFDNGMLKGFGVGGAYRWEDKVVIGYPVNVTTGAFELNDPFYGPTDDGIDLWCSYQHKILKGIDWKIQLNITNAFAKNGLIPISVEPNGQYATERIKPVQEWSVTNTFSF